MEVFTIEELMTTIFKWLFIVNINKDEKENIAEQSAKTLISLGKDLRSLSCVDHNLNNYYSDEDRAKKIVAGTIFFHPNRIGKINNLINDYGGIYHQITSKINRLFNIVFDQSQHFMADDLGDPFYLNVTLLLDKCQVIEKLLPFKQPARAGKLPRLPLVPYQQLKSIICLTKQTLLTIAFKTRNLTKFQQLVEAGIKLDDINEALLLKIVQRRVKPKRKNERIYHFTMIMLLLEHGIKIDINCLVYAVAYDDEELAYILLKYGVNYQETTLISDQQLYLFRGCNQKTGKTIFQLLPGKNWFLDMIKNYSR